MTVGTGTRLGPYEIVSRIGAGGMGEVFRATDTRLDRSVAIKVLPPSLAQDVQFRARFEREAKLISSLNHPNICTLHDVGNADGVGYLVMELLEGETLADRLSRGAVPVAQVLTIGVQIASALEKAHRQGVIHRDLKPANVMLTKGGAKLLDFGLATNQQAVVLGRSSNDAPSIGLPSATEHRPLTQEGTILGTFQYMAPEQLEGQEADARTDIFALGAVLYEMATGKRAFEGKTKTSLIAAIIKEQPPPVSQVQPLTPPAFEHVVAKCLEKDPDDRWQSAQDVATELKWVAEAGSQVGVPAPLVAKKKIRERLAWLVAGVTLLSALAFAALWLREKQQVEPAVASWIIPPDGIRLLSSQGVVLSPDGSRSAFIGFDDAAQRRIYVRAIGDTKATPLQGTEEVGNIFWSPDGKHIGYFTSTKLKRVPATGGPSQVIAPVETPRGGTWGIDGTIVYAPSFRAGLFKVSSAGGTPVQLTKPDPAKGDTNHRHPLFLPGGKHVLFLAQRAEGGAPDDPSTIDVVSLESGKRRELVRANSSVLYSPPGYILFARQNALVAQRLDLKRLETEGEAFVVASDVAYSGNEVVAASVSENGALTYMTGGNLREARLVWFDRTGKETGRYNEPGAYVGPALSPDGTRVAVELNQDTDDIWIIDLTRQTRTRVTTDAGDEYAPQWSPDGKRIVFGSNRMPMALWTTAAGGGPEQKVFEADAALDWSRNDEIAVEYHHASFGDELGILSPVTRKLEPLASSRFNEVDAQFSPDARFVAFVSDQSGRNEVYVLSRATGERAQVSTAGGSVPRWNPDGSEIFYVAADRKLMAVPMKTSPALEAGTPVPLFEARSREYDVADGNRFLFVVPVAGEQIRPAVLVQNWLAMKRD